MSDLKPSVAPWIAGVVLRLLAAYVGSYYAMVEPAVIERGEDSRSDTVVPLYGGTELSNLERTVGREPSFLDYFFRPIHRLDRRIRSRVWK